MSEIIEIAADGGCRGNTDRTDNIGGYGVVLRKGTYEKEILYATRNTTNNIMEMKAVLEAMHAIKNKAAHVVIYTDSKYVCEGLKSWMNNWKKNGWKKADGGAVKNKELWMQLDDAYTMFSHLDMVKVKGHADHELNERADRLANEAMDMGTGLSKDYRLSRVVETAGVF